MSTVSTGTSSPSMWYVTPANVSACACVGRRLGADMATPPQHFDGHGNGGGTRFFVACSNAYARRSSVGSLQAIPVKLTPNGAGLALKPSGNAGVGAFGIMANGTITVG